MDTSHYDAEIQAAKDKEAGVFQIVDAMRDCYTTFCTTFFKNEFRRLVVEAVTKKPEITQRLGVERLADLKAELNEVVESATIIVFEQLDKDELWDHRIPFPEDVNDTMWQLRAGDKAKAQLNAIMGYAGQLILKYGFDDPGPDQAWSQTSGELPRYNYEVAPLDQNIKESMEGYKRLFKQLIEARQEVAKREKEKEQALAKDLWDQA